MANSLSLNACGLASAEADVNSRGPAARSEAKTLIVGLGKTGLSCARYLRAQGVWVAVTDSRARPPGLETLREELPEVAVFVGGFEPEVFALATQLVVSPGVPIAEPLIQAALARGVPVIGDVELFARAVQAPICAITAMSAICRM